MANEVRYVLDKNNINQLQIDDSKAYSYKDIYFSRTKRTRTFYDQDGNTTQILLIHSEPGMVVKQSEEITQQEWETINEQEKSVLKIVKEWHGTCRIEGVEWWVETVHIYKDDKYFIETHIEVENFKPELEETFMRITQSIKKIEIWMFDYAQSF